MKIKDLNPGRDYCYIDDLIDSIMMTLACEKEYSIYYIGSGKSLTVKEMIEPTRSLKRNDRGIVNGRVWNVL